MSFINSNPYLMYLHSRPDPSVSYTTGAPPQPIPMEYLYGHNPHAVHDLQHHHQQPLPPHPLYYAAIPFDDPDSTVPRPRLTKEQVGVLEAQFQAHSKPNSKMKRQLALQTNLTLPRVANWFQNRRAKAKQQKRQEDYEHKLSMEMAGRGEAPGSGETSKKDDLPKSAGVESSNESPVNSNAPKPATDSKADDVNATTRGEPPVPFSENRSLDTTTVTTKDPPPFGHPTSHDSPPPASSITIAVSESSHENWPASSASGSLPKHSFGNPEGLNADHEDNSLRHNWDPVYPTPEGTRHTPDATSPAPLPTSATTYGNMLSSEQEVTTVTNQQHDLKETPEDIATGLASGDADIGANPSVSQGSPFPNKGADIARRRKKPRPAAIGTSLGRSHAGPVSAIAITPPSGLHSLRQVKSTHNLGVDYRSRHQNHAGIRKISSSQRSPLNWANSVEAFWPNPNDALNPGSSMPPLSTHCIEHPHSAFLPPTPHDSSFLDPCWDGTNAMDPYMSHGEGNSFTHSPPITANALDFSNCLPQPSHQLMTSIPPATGQEPAQSAPAYKTSFLPEETDFAFSAASNDWLTPNASFTTPPPTSSKSYNWPDQSAHQHEHQPLSHRFPQSTNPVSPVIFNGLYNLPGDPSGSDELATSSPKDMLLSPAAMKSNTLKSETNFSGASSFPLYAVHP